MSKAFKFLTVQNEHTVYSVKKILQKYLLLVAEIIDDFMGHSVHGTLLKNNIDLHN